MKRTERDALVAQATQTLADAEGALAAANAAFSDALTTRNHAQQALDIALSIVVEETAPHDMQSRPVNTAALLQFTPFNSSRYARYITILTFGATIKSLEFNVGNLNGADPVLGAVPYELLCDGVVIATVTPSATASEAVFRDVSLASIEDGWHLFDLRGGGYAAHPLWCFVQKGALPAQTWAPIQTGSFGVTHEDGPTARWGKVPVTIDPPTFTLKPRTAVPFSTAPTPAQLYRRNLSPTINGDPTYLRKTAGGLLTCMNIQGYAFSTITTKYPSLVLRDGPYGVGTVPGATHLQIGRRGGVYFSDAWRIGHVDVDGTVRTFVGYTNDHNGLVLHGDWSAVPVERRGFHEIWGFAWRSITVDPSTLDTSVTIDGEHPHTVGPTMFVADSQNNRIVRVRFDPRDRTVTPVVDEWITGLSDPWDVVEAGDVLYVSERQGHRITMWSAATPQTPLGVLVQGPALATVDKNRQVIRVSTLATVRAQTCVAPEGLYLQDGWVYFGSIAMEQVKRVNIASGAIEVVCSFSPPSKTEYCKFAVSDGTFGPRGSVFISAWEVDRMGAPWAFKPDGMSFSVVNVGSYSVNSGKGGKWEGIGYSMACAVRNGRLIYSGADYGLVEITLAQTGDETIDATRYVAGKLLYDRNGHRQLTGINGFRQWRDQPLPWGVHADLDYFLTANGHAA